MELAIASRLSALCHEAYNGRSVADLGFTFVGCCTEGEFPFHVLSDDSTVALVFRGTRAEGAGLTRLTDLANQWVTSLDMAQQEVDRGYSVHRGFWKEITSVGPRLAEMLRHHDVAQRRFFVTGHSAGAALATLAARYLHEAGVATAEAVYVFASPRVGDRRFAESYPLPLYRFATTEDLIPHFPPPPPFWPRSIEYVHAGQLFLLDRRSESDDLAFLPRHNARHYRECLSRVALTPFG